MAESQQRRQQRVQRVAIQAAEVSRIGLRLALTEDGGLGGVGDGEMTLSPVEVIFHRTELKPSDLVRLRRKIDLAGNVLFGRSPEDARHDVVHRAAKTDAIRIKEASLPPLRR